jgi:heptosyltransferase-2
VDILNTDRILVRGVNWVGDAVMTMPAIRSLRKAYNGSKISLLVKPSVSPVFEGDPNIDEIIIYEDRFDGFFGKLKLAGKLRRMKFSRALLLQNAFDAALIAYLSGIPERIGYNRDGRGFLLTKSVPFDGDDRKVHHIDYYLNLLTASGIKAEYSHPWIYLSIQERLSARERLSGLKRPLLGINPGATYGSTKRWFPERFAEVANWFIKDTGGSVIIFSGKNEVDIAQEINKYIPDNKLFLAGKTSLREFITLVSECDVFITNDSGPMHVAYAVGTPLVAIFGSTSPELTGPAGNENVVLKADFECSPCFERDCKKQDMRCMLAITSEEVFYSVKRLLPEKHAVFFDRDGTLCRDAHFLNNWEGFKVFPEVDRLKILRDKGFALIGVSNQSGIAKGIVDESFTKEVNRMFIERYGFEDFYYCPHSPDENCPCRKPEPAMLFRARTEHNIDLKKSFIVGDKDADMLLAKAVGARGILVKTGQHQESENADVIVDDLSAAVKHILKWNEL